MSTSNNSNQQTLAESGTNERPPMLEKGNYILWESKFRRFLDNKLGDRERMVMNYLLQAIPNDIYNSVDACKNAKEIWERTKRLTTLVNIIDRNNFHPISVLINTKFLNCLQREWSKYVTMVHHNQIGDVVSYDVLYNSLIQFQPHVLASKAKKAAKNHDPLALLAHSNASSSQSHENSCYSSQPYYVTHPSSVVDYYDEYQGDYQEDKLTTAMMLLARAISQKFFKPTNNRLRISSNTRNQVVVQDGRVDIQTKNAEELIAAIMLMARIQPADGNAKTVPSYDAKAVSEVNASSKVHD
ncbi:hypothetical protein Tco_1006703 [Tanacetum coccineum]|uniref:Uncharacterized protein n=1 Tax=Tanacetum coccineum TaxID=301880 RepID=A0ABQ5FIG1_9ASTR